MEALVYSFNIGTCNIILQKFYPEVIIVKGA